MWFMHIELVKVLKWCKLAKFIIVLKSLSKLKVPLDIKRKICQQFQILKQ